MHFSIRMDPTIIRSGRGRHSSYRGMIEIGEYHEEFVSLATFWKVADYERQWREGLLRLLGEDNTCLLTSVYKPNSSHMLFWWLGYREGENVFFQDSFLLFEELPEPFDLRDPYRAIPPHVRITEEGLKVSEWTSTSRAIRDFVERLDNR